jgi:ABC-type bacteriocin/lantibiotic exporter with double-glycine peptidase domain
LFGDELDKARYFDAIQLCELSRDMEILQAGDLTEIGEKGINLSGGQKARISLARAVYSDKDIFLMDDPISALDATVRKQIIENVILGKLKDKTRILVTHAIDFVHFADTIIIMEKGRIAAKGSFEDLKDNEAF